MRLHRGLLASAIVLFTVHAHADPATTCIRESERAQLVRDEGHLVEARDLFRGCAREECPRVVRRDCAEFASDLDRRIPTIVLVARTEHGKDLTHVRVSVDAKPLVDDLSGAALAIDPGKHVFRFEADGRIPVEVTHLVREGEKSRAIEAMLVPPEQEQPAPPPPPVRTEPPAPARREAGGIPALTFVLGGVAIAGGAAFGVLSYLAVEEAKDLENACAPRCTDAQIAPVETKFLVARVAGGLAITAAIGAFIVYAFGRGSSRTSVRRATPLPGVSGLGFTF